MPTAEWMRKYEEVKGKLISKIDLDAYFTENKIGNMAVDALDIGAVRFPTGTIFACDPFIELEDTLPYIQTIPAGTYSVKICVVPSEKYGDRYACIKVAVSDQKPVRYELGMVGNEDLEEELEDGEFFGFFVDAGMGCIADIKTQEAFRKYWEQRLREEEDIDPYNDLYCDLLEESYRESPKYQRVGAIGRCRGQTVTSLSSPPAGATGSILCISVMTLRARSAACMSISLMLREVMMRKTGGAKRNESL